MHTGLLMYFGLRPCTIHRQDSFLFGSTSADNPDEFVSKFSIPIRNLRFCDEANKITYFADRC